MQNISLVFKMLKFSSRGTCDLRGRVPLISHGVEGETTYLTAELSSAAARGVPGGGACVAAFGVAQARGHISRSSQSSCRPCLGTHMRPETRPYTVSGYPRPGATYGPGASYGPGALSLGPGASMPVAPRIPRAAWLAAGWMVLGVLGAVWGLLFAP